MKKILASALVALLSYLPSIPIALANQPAQPFKKTFIVTAYYSPLEGQSFYIRGNLKDERRLNGNGWRGADGTDVYFGMIAAPRTYAFGTQIDCGPHFSGTVHDRGGAIVKAGVRGQAHDRLDIWTGHGEEGLLKALAGWGKRTVTCTVYPPGHEKIPQFVNIPDSGYDLLKQKLIARTKNLQNYQIVSRPTQKVPVAYSIPAGYREKFEQLGYENYREAVVAFQVRRGIVASRDDGSAGNVGPETKRTINEIFHQARQNTPVEGLQEGDISPEVRVLQEALIKLGYLNVASTAIFGKQTKQALTTYQFDKKLISSADDPAAGYMGPGTQKAMFQDLLKKDRISAAEKQQINLALSAEGQKQQAKASLSAADELQELEQVITLSEQEKQDLVRQALQELSDEWVEDHRDNQKDGFVLASSHTPDPSFEELKNRLRAQLDRFNRNFAYGDRHQDIEDIQHVLKREGFFTGEITTTLMGPQTVRAIREMQERYGIARPGQKGYGIIGPATRRQLNALYNRQFAPIINEKVDEVWGRAIKREDFLSIKTSTS